MEATGVHFTFNIATSLACGQSIRHIHLQKFNQNQMSIHRKNIKVRKVEK